MAHWAPAVIRPSSPTEICRRGLWSRCITPLRQCALKQPNWPLHPWTQQAALCYGLKWINCFTESCGTSEFPFPMWFIDFVFFTVLSYLVYLAKSTISNYLQEWGNTFFLWHVSRIFKVFMLYEYCFQYGDSCKHLHHLWRHWRTKIDTKQMKQTSREQYEA